MSFYDWKPYVPVAARRAQAARALQRFAKKGALGEPVVIVGRAIARTFWGKAWCENLERYSDFSNRLPRGRTYVRNGSVVDLSLGPGRVEARVSGSSLYKVTVEVTPLAAARWKALCRDCAGGVDSVVELLQGQIAGSVMERLCRPTTGLFPAPSEIRFECSCPDWASMCKHVAATLYGIGARLDQRPELFFALRQVDEKELIAQAGDALALKRPAPAPKRRLGGADLSALFGIDLDVAGSDPGPAARPKRSSAPSKGASVASKAPSKKSVSRSKRPSVTTKKKTASSKRSAASPQKSRASVKRAKPVPKQRDVPTR